MKKYLFLSLFAAFCSCTHYKSTDYEGSIDEGYPNGIYDAIIHVYNPNTKHNATYTLEVEVENEYLIKIYWNNGGWLDDLFCKRSGRFMPTLSSKSFFKNCLYES